MKVMAKLNHLRMSPRKVRLVADVIRGLDVKDAEEQLRFIGKRGVFSLRKLLQSAVSNAEQQGLVPSNLYVCSFTVDGGPILKRYLPRMGGRASPIRKRTSHITIVLEERELQKKKRKSALKGVPQQDTSSQEIKGEESKERHEKRLRAPKEERGFSKRPGFVKKVFRRKSI